MSTSPASGLAWGDFDRIGRDSVLVGSGVGFGIGPYLMLGIGGRDSVLAAFGLGLGGVEDLALVGLGLTCEAS